MDWVSAYLLTTTTILWGTVLALLLTVKELRAKVGNYERVIGQLMVRADKMKTTR